MQAILNRAQTITKTFRDSARYKKILHRGKWAVPVVGLLYGAINYVGAGRQYEQQKRDCPTEYRSELPRAYGQAFPTVICQRPTPEA